MDCLNETLMQLISSEVFGQELHIDPKIPLSEKLLVELLVLSSKHNVANIIASALLNNGLLEKRPQQGQYMTEFYRAVCTYEKQSAVFADIADLFDKNDIDYIPLKGTVIRDMYPQPWLRTSCDIDILVKENDLKSATDILLNVSGYTLKSESTHDVVLISPDGVLVELHFKLIGNRKSPYYKTLSKVWDTAQASEGLGHRFSLSNELFYCYHIVHMAKHFRLGGCGLRPFIDLMLIEKRFDIDYKKVDKLLGKVNLQKFAESARKLGRVWFYSEEHSDITLQMQKFILDGGVFGTTKTRDVSVHQRKGGKLRFIFSRIIVPYHYLKRDYPKLEKYPILTPFYEVCRIFSLMFGRKKLFKDTYINRLERTQENDYDNNLFDNLGLR